jgi:uncharacterized membrane protein YadS
MESHHADGAASLASGDVPKLSQTARSGSDTGHQSINANSTRRNYQMICTFPKMITSAPVRLMDNCIKFMLFLIVVLLAVGMIAIGCNQGFIATIKWGAETMVFAFCCFVVVSMVTRLFFTLK